MTDTNDPETEEVPRSTIPERFGVPEPIRENLVRAQPELEFRAAGDEGDGRLGTIFGRLVNYNTWAEVNSPVEGRFMEQTAPGAFKQTFAENRAKMRMIFDHGQDRTIGRKPLGPLEDIIDTPTHADYQGPLIDTSYNRDLAPGLRANVYGSSYRFTVPRDGDTWNYRPQPSAHNPEGLPERTVTKAKIIELGPTPFPVGEGTFAGMRAMTDEYLVRTLTADPERLVELLRSMIAPAPEPPEEPIAPPEDGATVEPALQVGAEVAHSDDGSRAQVATPIRRFRSREEWLRYLESNTHDATVGP